MNVSNAKVDNLLERLAQLDDGPGPADQIDDAHAQALIRGAMERGGVESCGPQVSGSRPARLVLLSRGFVVGAGVLAATAAAAALGAGVAGGWITLGTGPDSANQDAVVSHQSSRNSSATSNPQAGQPAPARTSEAPTVAGVGSESTSLLQTPAASTRPLRLPAVGLLAQANQYRRQKQYKRAHRAYLEVIKRYPGSRQAEAARVAAAALRLEHLSDAKGAAEQYRAAASNEGQLGEEASYGLAEAHRASGRHDLEQRQLRRFLREYSTSPLAPAAHQRLRDLERHGR